MHFVKGEGKVLRLHGPWQKDKSWMADIATYKYILTSALDRGERTSRFRRFIPVKNPRINRRKGNLS
jgi:hypothetical protein